MSFKLNKKYFFCVLISIIAIILAIFFADYYIFIQEAKLYQITQQERELLKFYYKEFIMRDTSRNAIENIIINGENLKFHAPLNVNSQKDKFVLFGCSFVYGYKIPIEKTMHYVLANYTKAPVYDFSFHGWGTNQMLYQLKNQNFYNKVNNPQFVIYTYIPDHIRRLYIPTLNTIYQYHGAFFKLDKNKQQLEHKYNSSLFERSVLLSNIINNYNFKRQSFDEQTDFLCRHILESNSEIRKHWPNSKFIVFVYFEDQMINKIRPILEEQNIYVISKKELINMSDSDTTFYLSENDTHPNDKAWDNIIPALVNYIEKL